MVAGYMFLLRLDCLRGIAGPWGWQDPIREVVDSGSNVV